jgi:hypothetical protein
VEFSHIEKDNEVVLTSKLKSTAASNGAEFATPSQFALATDQRFHLFPHEGKEHPSEVKQIPA